MTAPVLWESALTGDAMASAHRRKSRNRQGTRPRCRTESEASDHRWPALSVGPARGGPDGRAGKLLIREFGGGLGKQVEAVGGGKRRVAEPLVELLVRCHLVRFGQDQVGGHGVDRDHIRVTGIGIGVDRERAARHGEVFDYGADGQYPQGGLRVTVDCGGQVVELLLDHLWRSRQTVDSHLIDDHLIRWSGWPTQHSLTSGTSREYTLYGAGHRLEGRVSGSAGTHELRGLQQSWYERLLVLADAGSTRLKIGVYGLTVSHRLVGFPPALLARLPGDGDDLRPAITVNAQDVQDADDIGLVHYMPVLQARDVSAGPADPLAQLISGQPGLRAQRPDFGSQAQPAYIRADHLYPPELRMV